jgi:6-phosphogluconolactonase
MGFASGWDEDERSESVPREVMVFPDLEELSAAAADAIATEAVASVGSRGRFTIALAGGNTPRRAYEILAERYADRVPWNGVEVFFGDERFVPLEHPQSNFAMAWRALLARVGIPETQIHAIRSLGEPPELVAESYDGLLHERFGATGTTFDLVLLGVGDDGHTASLFPGDEALDERVRWVRAVHAPPGIEPPQRITLTYPAINKARQALVLCSGAAKRGVVAHLLAGGAEALRYPAALVSPRERLRWFLDAAAAAS